MDQAVAVHAILSAREGRLLRGGAKTQTGMKRKYDESAEQELVMRQSTELVNVIFTAVESLRRDDRLLRYNPVDCDYDFDIVKMWRQKPRTHAQ
eukprot:2176041-Karenia_brevis.AAC.1